MKNRRFYEIMLYYWKVFLLYMFGFLGIKAQFQNVEHKRVSSASSLLGVKLYSFQAIYF